MILKENNQVLILDFDSTIVSCEVLDLLADMKDKRAEVAEITELAMSGVLDFTTSLSQRLLALSVTAADIKHIIGQVSSYISESFLEHKDFIRAHADRIYIVSGGFKEVIAPVAKILGIHESHIYANTFVATEDGVYTFDADNPLVLQTGKVQAIEHIKNLHRSGSVPRVDIIGDGYTDALARLWKVADRFFLYGEHSERPALEKYAERKIMNFTQYVQLQGYTPSQPEIASL